MFFLKNAGRAFSAALAFAFFLTNCTSPDPFGKELFDGDASNFEFFDTLTVEMTVIKEDSVNTSSPTTYFMGKLDDPIFGRSDAILSTLFRPTKLEYSIQKGSTVDSIFMIVAYDAARCYGDTSVAQTVEVWQMAYAMNPDSSHFSTDKGFANRKIGSATFIPSPKKAQTLVDTTDVLATTDTTKVAYFKIHLDNAFGQEILNLDTADIETETGFFQQMRGLQLRATTPNSPFMFSLNMDDLRLSRVTLGYKQPDGKAKLFHMSFRANKFVEFRHDHDGSPAGKMLGKKADSLIYLQGMAGLKVKINLPYAKNLQKIVVNKADLELTMPTDAAQTGNTAFFAPASQLFFTERNAANTQNVLVSDVVYSTGTDLTSGFSRFGGSPETKNGTTTYRLAISDRLQAMIEDRKTSDFFLNLYPQDRTAQRVVLFGPKADQTVRAKILVKATRLQ